MRKNLIQTCCTLALCTGLALSLASCLPGKEQEKKVISQASEATKEVQVDRVTASMANAAQMMLGDEDAPNIDTPELRTVRCSNGKVVSYVPRTAPTTRNGELPPVISQRMRDDLKKRFKAESVVAATGVDSSCGVTSDMIAINSPVLQLDNNFAVASEQPVDDAEVVSIEMSACPDDPATGRPVPGVVAVKTMRNGQIVTDSSGCGAGLPDQDLGAIGTTTTQIPNWRKRLGGDIAAVENFTCIVGSSNCDPLSNGDLGTQIVCNNAPVSNDLIINPVFDAASYTFIQGEPSRNCGKGWSGQLVARVQKKICQVIRNGVPAELPATIFDVAYVGAKCSKNNVKNIATQCPAGAGTFFAEYDNVNMRSPVMLEPQTPVPGQPTNSLIALPGYAPASSLITGITGLLGTAGVYVPGINLRPFTNDTIFSSKMVNDMGPAHAQLGSVSSCNTVGNTCGGGGSGHVVIVLDRSASMGSTALADKVPVGVNFNQIHSCKAGLKNIFDASASANACQAARDFLQLQPANHNDFGMRLVDAMQTAWPTLPTAAQAKYDIMRNALTNAKYEPYLKWALKTGWDCRGRENGSGSIEPFPLDMFGTCSGSTSCDTCPGQCEASIETPAPPSFKTERVQAAEWTLKQIARMKLTPNTKVTIAEFLNDAPIIRHMTYCPPERQQNGACDLKSERQYLIDNMVGSEQQTTYVKTVDQQVTVPTGSGPSTPPDIEHTLLHVEIEEMTHMSGPIGITECYNFMTTGVWCAITLSGSGIYRDYDLRALAPFAGLDPADSYASLAAAFDANQTMALEAVKAYEQANEQSPPGWPLTAESSCPGNDCAGGWEVATPANLGTFTDPTIPRPGATVKSGTDPGDSNPPAPLPGVVFETPSYEYRSCNYTGNCHYVQSVCDVSAAPADCAAAAQCWSDFDNTFPSGHTQGSSWLVLNTTPNPNSSWYVSGSFYYCAERKRKSCEWSGMLDCRYTTHYAAYPDVPNAHQEFQIHQDMGNYIGMSGAPLQNIHDAIVADTSKAQAVCAGYGMDGHFTQVPFTGHPITSVTVTNTTVTPGDFSQCGGGSSCAGQCLATASGACYAEPLKKLRCTYDQTLSSGPAPDHTQTFDVAQDMGNYIGMSGASVEDIAVAIATDNSKAMSACNGYQTDGHVTPPVYPDPTISVTAVAATVMFDAAPAGSACAWEIATEDLYQQQNDPLPSPLYALNTDQGDTDLANAHYVSGGNTDGVYESANYQYRKCFRDVCFGKTRTCNPVDGPCPQSSQYNQCVDSYGGPSTYFPPYYVDQEPQGGFMWFRVATTSYPGTPGSPTAILCSERKPLNVTGGTGSLSPEAIACLDSCDSPRITETQPVEVCQNVTDVFGTLALNCSNTAFPTKLDYTPQGYSGSTTIKDVARKVVTRPSEPGATPVAGSSTPTLGRDFGGNSPVYKTLDAVLADPVVSADMIAQRAMAFVVMTDGKDTGAESPTQVKSLCGAISPFTTALSSANPNATPIFVSLNDASDANLECLTAMPNSTIAQADLDTTVSAVSALTISSGGVDYSDPAEAANFCNTHFSTSNVYTDTNIDGGGGGGSGPAICRPYEVDP